MILTESTRIIDAFHRQLKIYINRIVSRHSHHRCLMTILIPSLQKSKDTVKAAVCMSNLKQVGIGLMRYSQVKKD